MCTQKYTNFSPYILQLVRNNGGQSFVEALECEFTPRGGISTSILTSARALLAENNIGISAVCSSIRSQMAITVEKKRVAIKQFLNDVKKTAPANAATMIQVAKKLEPFLGTPNDPLFSLPSLSWLKQVVTLVDEAELEFQERVLVTVDAGDEQGIIAADHTFKHSTYVKQQQGRSTVDSPFGATANVFNSKGEPMLSLLVPTKANEELEEPLSQLRSNIAAIRGHQPRVLYVDDLNQISAFQKVWPELTFKQDHLHAMMRVSRKIEAKHSQKNMFQGELSACFTKPCRSNPSDAQAFKKAAEVIKRDPEQCTGLEAGFKNAFQKANGRYATPSAAEQAAAFEKLRVRWKSFSQYCQEAQCHLWSDAVDAELGKLIELAHAGYLDDPYPVADMHYVDASGKIHSRRGTSTLENYHKGQHKAIVGMKVGVQLAHKSLVNYQYRTLLTARATKGTELYYRDYCTTNQKLLLESNTASGTLFKAAFTGLSTPHPNLTAAHFVGGIRAKSAARIAAESEAHIRAAKTTEDAAAAKLAAISPLGLQVPLAQPPTAAAPLEEDAGPATMASAVEEGTNFAADSTKTPPRPKRKSAEGVAAAVAAEQGGQRQKKSSGGDNVPSPGGEQTSTSPSSSKKRRAGSTHRSPYFPTLDFYPLDSKNGNVRAVFDLVLQQYDAETTRKVKDFKVLAHRYNEMVREKRLIDPAINLLPTNELMFKHYYEENWRVPTALTRTCNPPPPPPTAAPAVDGSEPSSAPSGSVADNTMLGKIGRAAVDGAKKVALRTQKTLYQSFNVKPAAPPASTSTAAPEPAKARQGGLKKKKYCTACAWKGQKLVPSTHAHKRACPNMEAFNKLDLSSEQRSNFVKKLKERLGIVD